MSQQLDPILRPRSIAVIGASRRAGTIGHQILHNLVTHGYQGVVYPVNPGARAIHSVPAWPSVDAIPGEIDLAVIVVPKEHVLDVVEACGARGVKGLVVISAGFKEVGGEGVERERALLESVRRHGMRLVGPNCIGVVNTAEGYSMNATFAPTMPPHGTSSFMSQSGALGVTILDYAAEYGIGIHHFVSVGNKPDVSGNDLLEYWEDDEDTRVILMYLENFGNPRRFTRLARRVTRKKPIVVVKSGRTSAGARAASSLYVEALGDVTFRVQPVSEVDAREMIDSIRGRALLEGVRGETGVDRDILAEVIQRVSQLVGDHHRIAELDVNPFLARPDGGRALDARIKLACNGHDPSHVTRDDG